MKNFHDLSNHKKDIIIRGIQRADVLYRTARNVSGKKRPWVNLSDMADAYHAR